MSGRRPSLRLAVLLAYALVVHALVWATTAGAGHGSIDGTVCRGGTASVALAVPLDGDADTATCDLACAAALALDVPAPSSPAAMPVADSIPLAVGTRATAAGRWADNYPRGPPVA